MPRLRTKILTFFVLIHLLPYVHSFFNCNDVEFCTRIRNNPANDVFTTDFTDVRITDNSVETTLTNTQNGRQFHLTLTGLEHGIFGILIDDPENNRRRVQDVLDGEPAKATIDTDTTSEELSVSSGDTRAVIQSSPFRISIYRGDNLIIIINNRGLLVYEDQEPNVAIALDVYFPGAQRAYGLPQHADFLSLRTTNGNEPYRFYNVDNPSYDVDSRQALYGTIPVLYGHSTSRTSGVFWLNSAQTFVDIDNQNEGVQSLFFSESGVLELYVLTGPTLQESVRQYAHLTGVAPVPQYFALGYHQSRYNYVSIDDVKEVVNNFDSNDFPLDVIWLDIDYTDAKKYFTWNPDTFGDPIGLQDFLRSTGRKLVTIIDPHYFVQDGYFVYDEASRNGYFVNRSDGSPFVGNCWPGDSSWIDYFNPEARDYYSSLFSFDRFVGSTDIQFIWNDMNEPSVFDGYETSMPKDNVHYGGWPHRDVHNQYGFYQTMGTYKGLIDRMGGTQRPFVLTRSHFAGSQRYTAMWTGDNDPTYEHLRISIPMCLTEALGGISFCGADLGGFMGNTNANLLQRWTQVGAWLPFMRQHATYGTERREPYLFDQETQSRLRYAMQLRYFHLPYWYTIFYEHYRTGDPVIRPLSFHYASDENVLDIYDEWLIGENILASPVVEENASQRTVYLPGGPSQLWYDVENTLVYTGSDQRYTINVDLSSNVYFYRGGSIIPRRDTVRSNSGDTLGDPISFYILLDSNAEAAGTLYIDDTTSFEYKNNVYTYIQFAFGDNIFYYSPIDENADNGASFLIGELLVYRPPSIRQAVLKTKDLAQKTLNISYGPENKYLKIDNINIDIKKPFTIHLL